MKFLALALAVGVSLVTGGVAGLMAEPTQAQSGYHIALDADLSNGVCDPVDSHVTVGRNATVEVAACLFNPSEPPEAFTLNVTYDETLVEAPERPDVGAALDDNPDANAGQTTFGASILGKEWDCTSFGAQNPVGNAPQYPGGVALINCNANLSNPDNQLTEGVMAVVTFLTLKAEDARIGLSSNTALAGDSGNTFVCDEGQGGNTIPCEGATLSIGTDEATATPVAPTPAPTEAAQQTATAIVVAQTEAAAPNGPNAALQPAASTQTALAQITPAGPEEATALAVSVEAARATSTALSRDTRTAVGKQPTAVATAGSSSGGGDSNTGTVAVIAIVTAAAVAVGGGGYLYLRRRRRFGG